MEQNIFDDELPQQHVCKEEEVLTEQQLCNQERNSSLDQEDPEPLQIKEEQEELCIKQEEEEVLALKQETVTFMLTPIEEENGLSEDIKKYIMAPVVSDPNSDLQQLSNSSHIAEIEDEKGDKHEDSESTTDEEATQKDQEHRSQSRAEDVHNPETLKSHCHTDSGGKSLKCNTCANEFKCKSALQRHMIMHTNEKPYVCTTCGKAFNRRYTLSQHVRIHTENPCVCKTCGKTFKQDNQLSAHMEIHKASSNALRGRKRVWRRLNAQEGKRHFCKMALRTASEDEAEAQLYEVLADLEEMEKEAGIDPRPHKKRKKSPTVRLKKRNQEGFLIYDQRNPKTDQAGGSQPVSLTNPTKSGTETLTAYVGREPAASEELFRDINTEEVIDSQLQILQDALNCDDIAPRPTASHDWSLRRSQSEDRWCAARPELVDSLLAGECVQRGVCNRCSTKQAVIRCKDCFPTPFYCGSCDISTHKHLVLHNRETINNFYKPVPPSTVVNDVNGQNVLCEQVCLVPMTLPDNICDCEPQVLSIDPGQSAILITINGRYDLFLPILTCKTCLATWTPEMGDLVRNGYWPGSVTLQTIFHIDVFTSLEDLKITVPGLSRQAFVKMLEQRSRHFGRNSTICGDHLQKAFLEWTYCRHEKEKLMGIDHFSCPACTPNTLAVSADGNRKLYRFRKTKGVEQKAFFDGDFISNDKEVADFVDCVRDKIKPVHGRGVCGTSRWAAARESSKTNPKVDEEGLEVAVCRHSLLLKALNMYRGEIFAYPMYLQKELAARTTCTYFCTDVMCQYWPYLQRVAKALPDIQNLLQMTPLLSAMHVKGHATKCEILWGGKNQSGAGTAIEEEAEQANSFLSRVAITTKYMTKSARIDMISIHARGWNLRKKARLHKYLSTRYMKTIKQKDQAQEDIEAIKRDTRRSDEELQQWVTDVRQWAVDSLDDVRTDDPVALQNLIEGLFLGIQQKTRDLCRVNARNKLRHKQQKQIVEDKKRLSEAISQYNNLATTTKSVASIEELLATDSPIWPWDCDTDISINKKKKVFDKMMELERLAEEETILVEEMKQHWSSLIRSSRDLRDQAEALSEDLINQSYPSGLSAQAYHGLHSAILFKLEELKTDMAAVKDTYEHMVLSRGGENSEDSEDEVDDEDDCDEDDEDDNSDS